MQLRVTIPTEVLNPAYDRKKKAQALQAGQDYNETQFITVPAGTVLDIDCARNLKLLVHAGQGEPFDDEARSLVPEFNGMSQEYLESRRDQLLCGHTTGNPKHDRSDVINPEAFNRIRDRLRRHNIKPESEEPVHVMQAGLKLTNEKLKDNANASIQSTGTHATQAKAVPTGTDSGSGDSNSKPDGK